MDMESLSTRSGECLKRVLRYCWRRRDTGDDGQSNERFGFSSEYEELHKRFLYHLERQDEEIDSHIHISTGPGDVVFVHQRLRIAYDAKGNATQIIGVVMNHTAHNERDGDTRLNDEKFYRLFGDAPIGIALIRVDGTCILANKSLSENVQYKEYELKNLPFQMLIDDEDQHAFMKMYHSVIQQKNCFIS